ncbi:hypothetical protein B0A48_06190 [Cryoendolithus antarcticus]|uniref:HMG box domain-containing protein n=1 Tax=Cryoendolithus antarcticus TaxID=1507870 RepID=A0A1V8TAC7_9PEZI|nr:hypothetical protein B0A48_06190 [Cryoendolithus antarcticus]
MPDEQSEQAVSIRSHSQGSSIHPINTSNTRRPSSIVSSRSLRSASSPSGLKTPLTPKESPPFRSTRKRTASIAEREDNGLGSSEATPAHTRASSGNSAGQVCLCQPDPKIPRPRNAFILYRQHHQAKVVAQHPGLANPDISKIIGEQWRNQPNEVKNEWKALADEEKIRHQQQYPTYRYQPKRNGRRNSITSDTPGSATSERPRCNKCGGRTILAPPTPYASISNAKSPSHAHLPGTPGSGPTPISRTLPILRDLSLQSPAARRMRQYAMTPSQHHPDDTIETIDPLSPDAKRRRFNEHPPQQSHRAMPPRYATAPPEKIHPGPGTPFPFGPGQQPYAYAQPPSHIRRDSLPGLRGMVLAPGPMPPPPRPGMGYQQHRMSQGGPDRSLTLPPLQTGTPMHHQPSHSFVATPRTSIAKPVDADLPFRYKLDVLRQIAPPAPIEMGRPRGPLVSIEGEDVDAVKGLASWLASQLVKDGDVDVKVLEGPGVSAAESGSEAMANHHDLAAEWLRRNESLVTSLRYGATAAETPSTAKPTTLVRRIEEILDDDDDATPTKAAPEAPAMGATESASSPPTIEQSNPDAMSISPTLDPALNSLPSSPSTMPSTTPASARPTSAQPTRSAKSVTILPLFTLHATNTFTSLIPITDSYSLKAHWEWAAAQWRGVVGPDLTIYVKDGGEGKAVEMSEEGGVCGVRREVAKGESEDVKGDPWEGEEGTLRRVAQITIEDPTIAPSTSRNTQPTTADTPMKDTSTANDVQRSTSGLVHASSDNSGITQVSTDVQQTEGQIGSDKSNAPTYTTKAAQSDGISTMTSHPTSSLSTTALNGERSQQDNSRAPGTCSASPTMIDQIEQIDSGEGSNIQSADEIMADISMDWDANLDTKLSGENIDYGDAIMDDLTTAMVNANAIHGSAADVQIDGGANADMQNVLSGIDDLETGNLPLDMLFSKLAKATVDRKTEPAELLPVQHIPASIFGGGPGSWNFDELLAEPRDSQMEVDGQSTYVAEPVQDPKLRTEIPDSQLEAPIQIPAPEQPSTMSNTGLPGRVLPTEVPDSQMEDVDPMVASLAPPAEDDQACDSDASDNVRPSNYRAATVESETSDYDDEAMAEGLQEAEKRREYALRASTKTGRHPAASSWIDQDKSGNYDPDAEAEELRRLARVKKQRAEARLARNESNDEETPDEAADKMVIEDDSAPDGGDTSVQESDAEQAAANANTKQSAETQQEGDPDRATNSTIGTGLGESILGPQRQQSQAASDPSKYAPVLQNLRRHESNNCFLCKPQFRLFGDRDNREGSIVPTCYDCRMARFRVMICNHEKIRRIPEIDERKPDFEAAKSRAMQGIEDEADVWCSLCCELAVHRCKSVTNEFIGCGLALCRECSYALREDCNGNLGTLLGKLRRGKAGPRKHGWRADALLLELEGPLARLVERYNT